MPCHEAPAPTYHDLQACQSFRHGPPHLLPPPRLQLPSSALSWLFAPLPFEAWILQWEASSIADARMGEKHAADICIGFG